MLKLLVPISSCIALIVSIALIWRFAHQVEEGVPIRSLQSEDGVILIPDEVERQQRIDITVVPRLLGKTQAQVEESCGAADDVQGRMWCWWSMVVSPSGVMHLRLDADGSDGSATVRVASLVDPEGHVIESWRVDP